ncbi:MAG: hypothetical protein WD069_09475 [Planctomycetales bacterium]
MHVSRRGEFIEVVSRSPRPRDPYRSLAFPGSQMTRHFFATAADLLPVFDLVDRKHRLAYTLTGLHESPELRTVTKGSDIPTLRDLMEAPNAIACPSYLVTLDGAAVQVREVPQQCGGIHYAVDQLINTDSITFSHGGFFSPEILLYGRVGTASDSAIAKKLFRVFSSAIAKAFVRVKAYWVGPQANELLLKGCRLTMSANSPKEYDLAV